MILGLAANQVACGLALTILGRRPLRADRRGFRRRQARPRAEAAYPRLVGHSLYRADPLRPGRFRLRLGRAVAGGGVVPVAQPHRAHAARARRQSRLRACAWPPGAADAASTRSLFGGGCSGLAGAYLSLGYTPFWVKGMTAGRGWIALALGRLRLVAALAAGGRAPISSARSAYCSFTRRDSVLAFPPNSCPRCPIWRRSWCLSRSRATRGPRWPRSAPFATIAGGASSCADFANAPGDAASWEADNDQT